MIIYFGDKAINLEGSSDLTTTFPVFLFGRGVGVKLSIGELEPDDLTAMYNCGDMLSNDGDHIASSSCRESPTYKIQLIIQIRDKDVEVTPEGTVRVQVTTCHAVSCAEHCMAVAHQLMFVAAVFLGIRFSTEDELENGDDISPDDPT